tara:strand:- start:65 stop:412 length:348 start_codon:yes stop_codon:yes gene_type:complete
MMMNPKKATSMTAIVLILVGILSYFAKSSPTALIPVFFGVLMGICYMLYDKNNKLFAHIILVLMLVVFIALFMPLNKRIDAGDFNGILRVGIMQLVTLYSMACFVVSFIKARQEK